MNFTPRWALPLVLALLASPLFAGTAAESIRTPAELSGFEATPSYAETLDFLRRLNRDLPEMQLQFFGTSAQGRPMPLVVVSADRAFTPAAAAATGKAIVLVQNGIHSGEIDGKDASLMILRDLAEGRHRRMLDGVILLIVPIYNVDGHERVSPFNRPNQNGPVQGMGFRTTTDGHDLNRDHLKLATPEARAVIRLFNDWRPHLQIDNHVTDGVDHDWVLTYSWAEAPQIAPSLEAWLSATMPAVIRATEQASHRVGPYVSLNNRQDPSAGFNSWVGEPRYATGYYPLRHRPSILVENHSYKPFRERVLANRDFMLALFSRVAEAPRVLIDAVDAAERRTVQLGLPDAPGSKVDLVFEALDTAETIRFPVYEWFERPSQALGTPIIDYRTGVVREIDVPWIHRGRVSKTLPRPRGYLIQAGWPVIERRLHGHGLEVQALTREVELDVEMLLISEPEPSATPYQGLTRVAVRVERRRERRRLPAGTLWVPAAQPDFEVAVQLLEPEAPDSLVSWGLLSSVTERKEYIDPRILENEVETLLEDPRIAAEWQQALKDEGLASDPQGRYMWWYRRTRFWDETVGRLPVMRLIGKPEFETRRWSGPADPAR